MTATISERTNVVTLPFKPRLLDAPPRVARPEPRNSHDMSLIEAEDSIMLIMEIRQRLFLLRDRHGLPKVREWMDEMASNL